jgi:hypothetical protein
MVARAVIKKLWLDPNYRGSFSGIATFYRALKKDGKLGKNDSYEKVFDILTTIPSYQIHVRRSRKYETRHLNFTPRNSGENFIDGVGISFQMDLGVLPESDGKLLCFTCILNV